MPKCSECGEPVEHGQTICHTSECLTLYAFRQRAQGAIPKRYKTGFRWYTPTNATHISELVDWSKKWAQQFTRETSRGIYFWRYKGSGKTGLACSILLEVGSRGYSVAFVTAAELLRSFQATFNGENGSPSEIQKELLEHDLIVIDDLGVQKASAWASECLMILFDEVARNMRPVIIVTSNLSRAQEVRRYQGSDADNMMRAVSRLSQITEEIEVSGKNLRELKQ